MQRRMMRYERLAVVSLLSLASILFGGGDAAAEVLSAEQAVSRAVAGNPSLRAALYDLQAARASVRAAESSFRPTFTAEVGGGRNEGFSATVEGIAPNGADSIDISAGARYGAPWGTELALELTGGWNQRDVNRDPSATTVLNLGSTYGAEATLSLSQPLLRGAGRDVGEASLRQARHSRTAAEHARDLAASELLRDVLQAYWELWYAQAAVEVQRAAQELAQRQLSESEARVRTLGTVAQTDSLRYATELASIEEALAEAEATRRSRATELGRLLDLDTAAALELVASQEEPSIVDEVPAMEELVAIVRESSAELLQLAAELESTRDQIRVAENEVLPQLDLEGSFGVIGLWNDDTISALSLPDDRPAFAGRVNLALELPLGNGQARADLAEARHRAAAAEARQEARVRVIEAEVASLLSDIESSRQRLELARRSAALAQRLARAEQESLRLGTSTTTNVLDAQESARQTELRRLRALVDLAEALHSLSHLSGGLLAHYAELVDASGDRP